MGKMFLLTEETARQLDVLLKVGPYVFDTGDFRVVERGLNRHVLLRDPEANGMPKRMPQPFQLSRHLEGARVYRGKLLWDVTALTFEKKFLYDADGTFLDDVNSLAEQEEIAGPEVMEIDGGSSGGSGDGGGSAGSGAELEGWHDLTWFGDVWAVVELNGETGEPVRLTLEGPDKPEMRSIPLLNSDLSRGSGSGSESGERMGWCVLLGNVPETGKIRQEWVGNLSWYLAFVPEAESSSSGSSGSSGGSSSSGSSRGSGSSKDTAIVPTPWGYRKWYAMEAAEVLFFDFMEVEVVRGRNVFPLDPMVLFCVEQGTLRAFPSPARGCAVAHVDGDELVVEARHWPWPRTQRVQVMLKGVRRGFAGVRNELATMEEYIANELRLRPDKTREEVMEEVVSVK